MNDDATLGEDDGLPGVDPRRRALVRRRLDVVRRYLALAAPTLEDDADHARELGLLPPSFLVLVRAYREHGTAAALPGARVPTKRVVRDGRFASPGTEAAVSQAIDEIGPDATSIVLLARIERICQTTGAPVPSLGMIHLRRAKARRKAGPVGIEGMVLDHVALDLPVATSDGPIRLPVLTMVIDGRSSAITGWSLATVPPTAHAAASALLAAARRKGVPVAPLRMAVDAAPAWDRLLGVLAESGVQREGPRAARLPAGSTASRMLGDRLGGIRLLPRRVHRIDPPHLRSRFLHTPEEAEDAVEAAVQAHNVGRGTPLPALVAVPERSRLVDALEALLKDDGGPDTEWADIGHRGMTARRIRPDGADDLS